MAETMIERVARGIMMNRDNGACKVENWTMEARDNPHVEQALRQARAAIEAMRVPTPEMRAAVKNLAGA